MARRLPELRIEEKEDQAHQGSAYVDHENPDTQKSCHILALDQDDCLGEREGKSLSEVQKMEGPVVFGLDDLLIMTVSN